MTRTAGKSYCLNIATVSDIHLGNPRVSTESIIRKLENTFPSSAKTGELDILFIAGDLFDQLLNLSEDRVTEIHHWIHKLLLVCKKWDIKLRVLEGTPSHDRGQSALFNTINKVSGVDADCKYVDVLSIEYMEDLDLHILYVPDEWHHDPNDTWEDVKAALAKANIDKVDYAIMHGVFEGQLPKHLSHICHDSKRYLSIVKKYIFIGHHHTMWTHDRILAEGSFDRLKHGEEEAKGHFRLTVRGRDKHDLDEIVFVENKEAAIFKTLNLVGIKDEKKIKQELETLCQFPIGSSFRVIIERFSPHVGLVDSYQKAKTEYKWQVNTEAGDDDNYIKPISFDNLAPVVNINKNNIKTVIEERLKNKGHNDAFIQKALQILEVVI